MSEVLVVIVKSVGVGYSSCDQDTTEHNLKTNTVTIFISLYLLFRTSPFSPHFINYTSLLCIF